MQLKENILLAIGGLRSNKMRALLTMLGIIIGVGSVIGIVTVGNSLTNSVTTEMSSIGATNVTLVVSEKADEFNVMAYQGISNFSDNDLVSDEMIDAYRERFSGDISAIGTFFSMGDGRVDQGRRYANISVNGTTADSRIINNLTISEGRFLTDDDINGRRSVAVVSDKFVSNIFRASENPIGKEITLTVGDIIEDFTIVGVYEYVPSSFEFSTASDQDVSTTLHIPISTARYLAGSSNEGYMMFNIMVNPEVSMDKAVDNMEYFFNRYYEDNPRFQISTVRMESMIDIVSTMLGTISLAVSVIAGISLIVGGIGVMNIMLVSVTERTREIGTRKALGAKNSFIMAQFITEAVIICTIGGMIGVGVGLILGNAGSNLMGYPAAPSISIIVISVLFSMFIGVFFGYYPARKAANLDPIEALRYE